MMLELDPEDEAFLTRLFGLRIPQDDTSFRPALERIVHVDVFKKNATPPYSAERYTKPMLNSLVQACLYRGIGTGRSIVGWSLEETDEAYILGILVTKQKIEQAA